MTCCHGMPYNRGQAGRLRWHDVEITSENCWNIKLNQTGSMKAESVKPSSLIVELRARCGIAVRGIETPYQYSIYGSFDVTTMHITWIAWQTTLCFDGLLVTGKNRDAIPTALAVPHSAVSRPVYFCRRKFLIRTLKLLKAHHIWFGGR